MQQHEHDTRANAPSPEEDAPEQDASAESAAEQSEMSTETAMLITELQTELEEAIEGRKRALADFRNFQRRAMEQEGRMRQDAEANVVRSLLPVLDHFDLALNQDRAQLTVDQLIGGVKIVRDELNKALQTHGVQRIEPKVGEPFDPRQHEAMMRQPAEGVAPNSVVAVLQAGFAMGDTVLRPAKVSISPSGNDF